VVLPHAKLPAPAAAHQVRRPSLKDTVGLYIRDLIFNGHLLPGERIDQDAVAETLGVSKLPVREALITLESAALVDVVPRRGAFVAHITKDDLIDHYRIYASISMIAAERAAETLTPADLKELQRNAKQMRKASTGSDREKLNHEFHRIINKAGGSRRLRVLLRGLETMMFAEFYRDDNDGWSDTAVEDHAEILAALERGDEAGAAEHMRLHIVNGGAHTIAILEQRGFWNG
jgi:DNA-binding GntR family transcriptional regulator